MIVSFSLKNQIIKRTDYNTVVAQSKNYLRAKFITLTVDWDGPITAIFGDYTVILDENNECVVPWEVLQNPGIVKVSAFCGDLHTASVASMEVKPSGYTEGQTPEPPTPGVYEQLTGMVQNAIDTAQSVRDDANEGKFNGSPGEPGEPGPQGEQGPAGQDAPQIDDTQASPSNPWSGEKVATELDKYAPIESAIKVSGTRTGLVSLSPTVAWRLQGLALCGRTTQDGTPSPENPVPLVSAGDGESIELIVSNKNLLTYPYLDGQVKTAKGITYTVDENGVVTANGIATDASFYNLSNKRLSDYPISPAKQNPDGLISSPGVIYGAGNNLTYIYYQTGQTANNDKYYPQIEFSAEQTAYVRGEAKSLLLSTPNGLSGIPVESGGNWTDEDGQQWISNILDFSTGMETVAVAKIDSYNGEDIPGAYMSTTGELTTGATVLYALAEPYTQPIDAETMEAYQVLTAYSGTTNIIAMDCGIQATAIADGTKYVEQITQRIAALESAATNI